MTSREKLIYLITNYNNGNYTTSDFCDLFVVYHRDMEDEKLSDFSEKWLWNLSDLCDRFSDSLEDLSIQNVYYGENEIKEYTKNFSLKVIYKDERQR